MFNGDRNPKIYCRIFRLLWVQEQSNFTGSCYTAEKLVCSSSCQSNLVNPYLSGSNCCKTWECLQIIFRIDPHNYSVTATQTAKKNAQGRWTGQPRVARNFEENATWWTSKMKHPHWEPKGARNVADAWVVMKYCDKVFYRVSTFHK